MRFALRDHRGQGKPFAYAMLAAGHRPDPDPDVVFIDYDLPHPAYGDYVSAARGKTLVVYPHGASFAMGHDLAGDPVRTDLTLVLGEGQKALLEAYDYPNPVEAIGWPWGVGALSGDHGRLDAFSSRLYTPWGPATCARTCKN